jgi:hypothetical protein
MWLTVWGTINEIKLFVKLNTNVASCKYCGVGRRSLLYISLKINNSNNNNNVKKTKKKKTVPQGLFGPWQDGYWKINWKWFRTKLASFSGVISRKFHIDSWMLPLHWLFYGPLTAIRLRKVCLRLSQSPCGLSRGFAAARFLVLWVRISLGAWISVSCDCCVLLDRCLCIWLITRP